MDQTGNRREEDQDGVPLALNALDPMEDEAHWHHVMGQTLRRVDAVLARRAAAEGPLDLIVGWRRPLLVAAATTIALLIPAELALERREVRMERVDQLVEISSGWTDGRKPAVADFLRAIGATSPTTEAAP
jgi:hypothetical protein